MSRARDIALAVKAKRHGSNYSLRIVLEARRAGVPISLGFALIEQESNFRNVFGSDPTIYVGAGTVTKGKYLGYRRLRGSKGQGGMQGVGPAQLTYYTYQDRADALGGCWVPKHSIRVAFTDLATMIAKHGRRKGLGVYNAGETGWKRGLGRGYADSVLAKMRRWHGRLT